MALRDAEGVFDSGSTVVAFFYKIELHFPISFSPVSAYVFLPYQTLRILMNSKNAFRDGKGCHIFCCIDQRCCTMLEVLKLQSLYDVFLASVSLYLLSCSAPVF